MKKLFFLLILIYSSNLFCCDCATITKIDDFNNANLIVIAKITKTNSKNFELKVIEVFKGKFQKEIKISVDYCTTNVIKGEFWLLYLTKTNDDYYASQCGNSRSFNFPFNKNSLNFPLPPPIGVSNEVLNLISEKDFKIAKLELEYDIMSLRFNKSKNEINLIKNENENLKIQITYLKSFIGFFILIILILFFIKRRRKN